MKLFKILTTLLYFFLIVSCSISKYQKMGNIIPENFNYKTEFTTFKALIILPMELNGVQKNFLFDTGSELSALQRDSAVGKNSSITGATNGTMKSGSEIIKSLKIGNIEFVNTFAVNGNMAGITEQLPSFGGLIGQSIISKANWLIDYPNKTIEISDKNLSDSTFKNLQLNIEEGRPFTFILIDDTKQKVLIDLGAATEFTLPKESKLAKKLLNKYKFTDNQRDQHAIGGTSTVTEKIGFAPLIKLGNIEFKNVKVTIGNSKRIRIGISFFKDCQIYIDNINNSYKIKKVNEMCCSQHK